MLTRQGYKNVIELRVGGLEVDLKDIVPDSEFKGAVSIDYWIARRGSSKTL
jgi:hypothetical protein